MLRPRRHEGAKVIYFSTNTPTDKVKHFRQNPKACVYFCAPGKFQGVMLQGEMEVLEYAAYKELLWRAGDELYYPGGVTDPNYIVLRFTAVRGRRYSDFSSQNFSL